MGEHWFKKMYSILTFFGIHVPKKFMVFFLVGFKLYHQFKDCTDRTNTSGLVT